MKSILLLGCGKIGATVLDLLAGAGDYKITVADYQTRHLEGARKTGAAVHVLDAREPGSLKQAVAAHDAVICACPHDLTIAVIAAVQGTSTAYFDLTEDVRSADAAKAAAAEGGLFIPQCGLAPGMIAIVANDLVRKFDTLDTVHLRVGALPQFPTNALKYNLTWSTDGLINEYCNPCRVIVDGRIQEVPALEGLESFLLDGVSYEAFNTSGGVGTLCDSLAGRVRDLNYKTVRYPGHREIMKLLIEDLKLGTRRDLLKDILENAVPLTMQDVVLMFVSVTGERDGKYQQTSYVKKIYGQTVNGIERSAIQMTTATGVCAVIDLWREGALPARGLVRQENIPFSLITANRFGRLFAGRAESSDEIAA